MTRALRILAITAIALFGAGCDSLLTKPTLYGSVGVQVTQRNGVPIPGVPLRLYTGERSMAYGATDADGRYTFGLVPDGRYGVATSLIPGYARLEGVRPGPPTSYVDQLTVTAGAEAIAQLSLLKQGPGTIVATVTEPGGAPVAGVAVTLYTGAGTRRESVTNGTGHFTFANVPFGNWGVSVLRPAHYLDSAEAPIVHHDDIIVDEGSLDSASFTFAPCTGAIATTVRDDAGAAIPGAAVTLYTSQRSLDSAVADAGGAHQFQNIECANYGVTVTSVPIGWTIVRGRGSSFVDGLFVHRNGTRAAALRVQRVACRGTLSVTVTDNTGATVPGAGLVVYTGSVPYQNGTTGASGALSFPQLPCDREWGVYVTPPATHAVAFGSGSSYFDGIRFTDGQTITRAFVLTKK